MTTALVMAGGRSQRMRATRGPEHKALVPVLGVPLLERNLCALLSAGFSDLAVVVGADEPELEAYVSSRGVLLARARGATLQCLREAAPLGTLGAAGLLRDRPGPVLVVNVDNLTAIDLAALVAHHLAERAEMTVATHHEAFRIPFGELHVRDGVVTGYREKPALPVRISSGTYVVSREVCAAIEPGRRTDTPALCMRLVERGARVAAYEHARPWIDVNDAESLVRAEELVRAHPEAFEQWSGAPDAARVRVAFTDGDGIWVRDGAGEDGVLPSLLLDGAADASGAARRIPPPAGWTGPAPVRLASFDVLETESGRVVRHHLFVSDGRAELDGYAAAEGWRRAAAGEEARLAPEGPDARALAWLRAWRPRSGAPAAVPLAASA
ncbi:MAG TPA: sugar phosphate nucleotidyltransferase [Longimicrobium sp.]|nr:sugar phosphate nucleotidyltransferase [Longimicrobium sp.]